MIKNYFKIALRAMWNSKAHSSINILGLGLGIACCVLIALFVKDEWTFDTFHAKANRIYRDKNRNKGDEKFVDHVLKGAPKAAILATDEHR